MKNLIVTAVLLLILAFIPGKSQSKFKPFPIDSLKKAKALYMASDSLLNIGNITEAQKMYNRALAIENIVMKQNRHYTIKYTHTKGISYLSTETQKLHISVPDEIYFAYITEADAAHRPITQCTAQSTALKIESTPVGRTLLIDIIILPIKYSHGKASNKCSHDDMIPLCKIVSATATK